VSFLVRLTDPAAPVPSELATLPKSRLALNAIEPEERNRFKDRLESIQTEIEDATEFKDYERIAELENERDEIARHLKALTNHRGRTRKISDLSEKQRTRVAKAIGRALQQIAERHGPLHVHLKDTIQTGSTCRYNPAAVIDWMTD
jgi:hypothetical protein